MGSGLALPGAPSTVLCLGSHCDDIEIGCGGAVLSLLRANPETIVHWVVFTGAGTSRAREAEESASKFVPINLQIEIHGFDDGYLPYEGRAIKDCFESMKQRVDPDLIFTHRLEDRHQDHRLVAELTWNTFRDHSILEYEIPKYEGDLRDVNCYVPIDQEIADRKIETILASFGSQRDRRWFTESTFRSLMRLRGVESNVEYAEGFYCRKFLLRY